MEMKWHVSGPNVQTVEELASCQGQPWSTGLALFSSFWIPIMLMLIFPDVVSEVPLSICPFFFLLAIELG